MCDTVVATGEATLGGVTLFAKNSDREPNEAQFLEQVPPMDHTPGSFVHCSTRAIAQTPHTHGVLLSRPFWMWGAEMGVNEFGLAIGNEAVFTREPIEKNSGLTGMELLRLALERAKNSRQGVDIITSLIETYGQGGNCGYSHPFYYHNSFILADPKEAWVLETAGRHWAALKIKGIYAISNGLTIENTWDLASKDLVANAVKKGWCRSGSDFSFSRCYSKKFHSTLSWCRQRRKRALELLEKRSGSLQVSDMTAVLRDHGPLNEKGFHPDSGLVASSICNHAGFGPIRIGQTTGSMVCHLANDRATHFATGTAAPCTGIFKPLWMDTPIPGTQDIPDGRRDNRSLFWRHETLHRRVLRDFDRLIDLYQDKRDRLENTFLTQALELKSGDLTARAECVSRCWQEAAEAEETWLREIIGADRGRKTKALYSLAWSRFNRDSGIFP